MKIGLVIAMDSEYRQLQQLSGQPLSNGNQLIPIKGGIGKVNAAVTTQSLIMQYHPDCIISSGVAGGIDSSLNVMDIVVADEVVYHDVWCGEGNSKGQVQGLPPRFTCHSALCSAAIDAAKTTAHKGLICTGDQFITDHEALSCIKADFPEGLAVDMESAAIAQVCHLYKVPFLACRIISDTPAATSDHFKQYSDFWGEMSQRSFESLRNMLISMPATL